jgi:DNA-binding transcriptional LysR family regulator
MQNLKLFCDVARHRSFSRAGAEHGITQSAVSQRISQLEKRLGVMLLDRSVRPLCLTAAGEVYVRGCTELIDANDRLERQVSQLRQLDGQVRVNAIYSAGIDLLQRVKELFELSHPNVTITVDYKRPEAVYDEVRQGRCDLGIVSFPKRWRDVTVIALRDERMAVVCRREHELSERSRVHAADLAAWPMVMFESDLPVARHVRKYLRANGAAPDEQSAFDNIDTIKSAVAVTDGIAILPTRTVLREVQAGTLAVVALEPPLDRPLGIIHAKRAGNGKRAAPAVEAFVDFLLEHAGANVDLNAGVSAEEAKEHAQLVG